MGFYSDLDIEIHTTYVMLVLPASTEFVFTVDMSGVVGG